MTYIFLLENFLTDKKDNGVILLYEISYYIFYYMKTIK